MQTTTLHVAFTEHMEAARIDSTVTFSQACGNVRADVSGRTSVVEVYRRSRLPGLRAQLTKGEG